jgi:hypothetical protein
MKVTRSGLEKNFQFIKNPTITPKDFDSYNTSFPNHLEHKTIKNTVSPLDKLSLSPMAFNTSGQEQVPNKTQTGDPDPIPMGLSLNEGLKYHFLRYLFLSLYQEDYLTPTYLIPPPSKDSMEKLKSLIRQAQISIKTNSSLAQRNFDIQIQRTQAILEKEQIRYSGSGVLRTKDGQKINFDIKLNLNLKSAEIYGIPIPGKKMNDSMAADFNHIV